MIRTSESGSGNGMEPDNVYPAFYSVKNSCELLYMTGRIVQTIKKDIFKGNSSLAVKIKIPYNIEYLLNIIGSLYGHQFSAFFIKR